MKTKIISLSVLVAVSFFACKKENTQPEQPPTQHSTSNMGQFFINNAVASQHFTINAASYETIIGTGGIKFYIAPSSFVTATNGAVTGNISIELKELYSKKDMILTGMLPMAGSNPLVSGGEFFIKATQGSQVLKLSGTANVQVLVPAGANPQNGMQEFYAGATTAVDTTGWSTNNDSISVVQDTTGGGGTNNYYYFQIDSMNWVNCDFFYSDPAPKTNVTANPGTAYNDTNCVVYVSINGINTIGWMYYNNGKYSTSNWPVGKAVTFIAISEINGQYYSCFKPSVITNNHNEPLSLTATTLAQIKQDLANLP